MPKKKKCGKNSKNKSLTVEKRKLLEADLDGQVYGIVDKATGCRYFTVNCLDNTVRRCKARSKRMRISAGDCVIIALRDFDDVNGDIIYKYDSEEIRQLQKMGALPGAEIIGSLKNEDVDPDEDDGFVFEDI